MIEKTKKTHDIKGIQQRKATELIHSSTKNNEDKSKKDLEILRALYFGNHLNKEERLRSKQILFALNIELKRRV